MMALQADAHIAGRKIIQVHHVLGHAAEEQGFLIAAATASSCARFFNPAMNNISTPVAS